MRFTLAGLEELNFLPSASHWAISLSTVGAKEMEVNCPAPEWAFCDNFPLP